MSGRFLHVFFFLFLLVLSFASLNSFIHSNPLVNIQHRKYNNEYNLIHHSSKLATATQVYPADSTTTSTEFPSLTIREAYMHDVFYPELRAVTSFHLRILEKLRNRVGEGAVCLIAVFHDKITSRLQSQSSSSSTRILGSVEISSNDFRNTSMDLIGHQRKLYAMDLAVRSDCRRMGIATQLLEAVEQYALKYAFREIYLHVEADNEAARNLYRKNGYVEVPRTEWAVSFTQHRLHKPPDCYVLLWKEIF